MRKNIVPRRCRLIGGKGNSIASANYRVELDTAFYERGSFHDPLCVFTCVHVYERLRREQKEMGGDGKTRRFEWRNIGYNGGIMSGGIGLR